MLIFPEIFWFWADWEGRGILGALFIWSLENVWYVFAFNLFYPLIGLTVGLSWAPIIFSFRFYIFVGFFWLFVAFFCIEACNFSLFKFDDWLTGNFWGGFEVGRYFSIFIFWGGSKDFAFWTWRFD
jgi:hypothetical protein